MDFVFLDIAPNLAVLGIGPFRFVRKLPDDCQVAFYLNDFGLSEKNFWAIPDAFRNTTSPLAEREVSFPELSNPTVWEGPKRSEFSRVFEDIVGRLAAGRLHKAVPAVVERVHMNGTRSTNGTGAASLRYDAARPGEAFRYGYRMGTQGAFWCDAGNVGDN